MLGAKVEFRVVNVPDFFLFNRIRGEDDEPDYRHHAEHARQLSHRRAIPRQQSAPGGERAQRTRRARGNSSASKSCPTGERTVGLGRFSLSRRNGRGDRSSNVSTRVKDTASINRTTAARTFVHISAVECAGLNMLRRAPRSATNRDGEPWQGVGGKPAV
jgi:hypothetical protein